MSAPGVTVVTGASRGIGRALAERLASDGRPLVLGCRSPAAAENLKGSGERAEARGLDVADPDSVRAFAESLRDKKIAALVNNAGILGGKRGSGCEGADLDLADEVFRTNVTGPLRLAWLLADGLAGGGVLVNVSSTLGSCERNTTGGMALYRASKAALNSVTRTLAAELGPRGTTVFAVHPGWVRTDMGGPSAAIDPERSAAGIAALLARAGQREHGRFLDWQGGEVPW